MVENGGRLEKKRKSEEINRVCRKNEKSTRGSRGSIKESLRKDEETNKPL